MKNYFFTSESVSEGHPDKMADQISDAVLDACLTVDPDSRVACETMLGTGFVALAGEITTKATLDFQNIVRKKVSEIGYTHSDMGFDANTCAVFSAVGKQSPDIAMGVDSDASKEQGAGDQGIMFGYAVNETPEFMPLTIDLSHRLVEEMARLRKAGTFNWARPDSKSQVTVEYVDGKVKRVDSVVISTQHAADISQERIHEAVREELITKVVPSDYLDANTKFYINPTGNFVVGGPMGDAGLTGRKIIVDTYGGHGAHGGGAFSGKDCSKVDRSAAYATRHIAKNIVAAGLADRCLVQVSYAIGVPHPLNIFVETYGTSKVDSTILSKAIPKVWDLRPANIVKEFDLKKPRFSQTAAYGHFGRKGDAFTWEKTNKVEQIKDAVKTLS